MNFQDIQKLNKGDTLIDTVTGAKFRVMDIDRDDAIAPVEVVLLTDVIDAINTDTWESRTSLLEIAGDRSWLYLNELVADEATREFQDREWRLKYRLLTLETLELA